MRWGLLLSLWERTMFDATKLIVGGWFYFLLIEIAIIKRSSNNKNNRLKRNPQNNLLRNIFQE